jgi:hypothetical protein
MKELEMFQKYLINSGKSPKTLEAFTANIKEFFIG